MAAAAIVEIKETAKTMAKEQAFQIAKQALAMDSSSAIEQLLESFRPTQDTQMI